MYNIFLTFVVVRNVYTIPVLAADEYDDSDSTVRNRSENTDENEDHYEDNNDF